MPKGVECLKVKSFKDVITHPEYNSQSSYINDIALVKLPSNKYQLNKKNGLLTLAEKFDVTGELATVAGFGKRVKYFTASGNQIWLLFVHL